MNVKLLCLLLLVINIKDVSAGELRFDMHGRMLAPDQTYLERGIDSQGRGHNNDAMRYLKKSARFGNPYAQSTIAFIHMKNKDYLEALAWFKLVNLKLIDKNQTIIDLIEELEIKVTKSQRQAFLKLSQQLNKEYGKQAALNHRENWRKSISFGGSKIKGHIPGRVKIYPAGRIEQRGFGEAEIFVSAAFVTGETVRLQLKEFIYDYEYKFIRGKVTMEDIEIIEEDQPI